MVKSFSCIENTCHSVLTKFKIRTFKGKNVTVILNLPFSCFHLLPCFHILSLTGGGGVAEEFFMLRGVCLATKGVPHIFRRGLGIFEKGGSSYFSLRYGNFDGKSVYRWKQQAPPCPLPHIKSLCFVSFLLDSLYSEAWKVERSCDVEEQTFFNLAIQRAFLTSFLDESVFSDFVSLLKVADWVVLFSWFRAKYKTCF